MPFFSKAESGRFMSAFHSRIVTLEDNVLFLHIPKSGGGSVERMFVAGGWDMEGHDPDSGVATQHAVYDYWSQWLYVYNVSEIFAIVRDPVDRLRSHLRGHMDPANPYSSFEDYINTLEKYLLCTELHSFYRDNHIRPQVDFLPPSSLIHNDVLIIPLPVDRYTHLDRLDSRPLLPLSDGKILVTDHIPLKVYRFEDPAHREAIRTKYAPGAPFPHVSAPPPLEWDDYELPHTTLKKIYKFYKEDYDRFDYAPPPGV
jgi:hypothetical protein